MVYKRGNPYTNAATAAYVTAINILAVEYLVKTYNWDEYIRRCDQVEKLTEDELDELYFHLTFNQHISSLGAMIAQQDYEYQREDLFEFLDGDRY